MTCVPMVDVALRVIRILAAADLNRLLDEWLNGHALNIRQHRNHDLATALEHTKDRQFLKCATNKSTSPIGGEVDLI